MRVEELSTSDELAYRLWVEGVLERVTPEDLVGYGSSEWLQLPEGSWERSADIVIAAELWRRFGAYAVDAQRRHLRDLEVVGPWRRAA